MSRFRMSRRCWDRIILWLAAGLFVWNGLSPALGRVEGRIDPVIADGAIVEAHEYGFQTVFTGMGTKRRACRLIEMRWYLIEPDGTQRRLPLGVLERYRFKPLGPYPFGPLALAITPAELLHSTIGEAWHDCHAGWPTISRIFDGRRGSVGRF